MNTVLCMRTNRPNFKHMRTRLSRSVRSSLLLNSFLMQRTHSKTEFYCKLRNNRIPTLQDKPSYQLMWSSFWWLENALPVLSLVLNKNYIRMGNIQSNLISHSNTVSSQLNADIKDQFLNSNHQMILINYHGLSIGIWPNGLAKCQHVDDIKWPTCLRRMPRLIGAKPSSK